MHFLWLLAGCTSQEEDSTPALACSPGEGEVFWLEGQTTFDSIDNALGATDAWTTLCLGPGQHLLEDDLLEGDGWSGQVHLIGSGVDQTSLFAPDHPDSLTLATGVPEQLVFQSLSLESPLGMTAQELVFDNVRMEGVVSADSLLQLTAAQLRLDGLQVVDSEFSYGGLILGSTEGETTARIVDLQWEGNRAQRGTHLVSQGERTLRLEGCALVDNYDASTSLGYPMLMSGGQVELQGCTFAGDRSSASVVSAVGLTLEDVEITDSRCATGGLLQAVGTMDLSQVSVQGSRSANAMLLLYSDGSNENQADFQGLDMGTQAENSSTCDFMVDGVCVRSELGAVDDWGCTDCRSAAQDE